MMRKACAKTCEIIQRSKSEVKNLKNIFNLLLESCCSYSIVPGSILSYAFFKMFDKVLGVLVNKVE